MRATVIAAAGGKDGRANQAFRVQLRLQSNCDKRLVLPESEGGAYENYEALRELLAAGAALLATAACNKDQANKDAAAGGNAALAESNATRVERPRRQRRIRRAGVDRP